MINYDESLKNRTIRKLKSNSGESIAETLVAVLIAALGLLMLAGTINTSSKLITKSKDALNSYYIGNNALAEESGTGSSLTVTVSKEGVYSQSWNVNAYSPTSTDTIGGAEDLISYRP